MAAGTGLINVRSNAQLEAEKKAISDAEVAINVIALPPLVAYVTKRWNEALQHKKQFVEPRLRGCLLRRKGEYSADQLSEIKAAGLSDIYMKLTSVKCRSASAWLRDALLTGDGTERPYRLQSTPIPDIPGDEEELFNTELGRQLGMRLALGVPVSPAELNLEVEKAKDKFLRALRADASEAAERAFLYLEDKLVEGGFHDALSLFLDDFVTYPAAIIKGPIVHRKAGLGWVEDKKTKRWKAEVTEEFVRTFSRLSPFDIYPAPWAADVTEGYLVEHGRYTQHSLFELIDTPNYDEVALRAVINQYGDGRGSWALAATGGGGEREGNSMLGTDLIDVLEYWGPVLGKDLKDWKASAVPDIDTEKSYECHVMWAGEHVIRAAVITDPLYRKPFNKACYDAIPGSFWGDSVPELMKDDQDMCNASARSLQNNMALASGPQSEVNIDRLAQGEDVTKMVPWRVWQVTNDPSGQSGAAVRFFQPNSNAAELLKVYEFFSVQADEHTGLPRYMSGSTHVGGAGSTASGMSMMMGNASKLIKQVVTNLDNMTREILQRTYEHILMHDDNPDLRGDVKVRVAGASAVMAKEHTTMRRNEFLMATSNPIDQAIMGPKARAVMLRDAAKDIGINVDEVMPEDPVMPPAPEQNQGTPPAMPTPAAPGDMSRVSQTPAM